MSSQETLVAAARAFVKMVDLGTVDTVGTAGYQIMMERAFQVLKFQVEEELIRRKVSKLDRKPYE